MNWYQIQVPHNSYGPQDVGKLVLLEGGATEAALELLGYLRYAGTVPETADITSPRIKRGRQRRGEPAEARQVQGEDVRDAAGEPARTGDLSAD